MRTVLVVEDHPYFLGLMSQAISLYSKGQLRLVTADSCVAALDLLGSRPVDLVVTDLDMADKGGLSVIRHLFDRLPHVPSMVVSGRALPEVKRTLTGLGVAGIFAKPVRYADLTREILDHLPVEDQPDRQGWVVALLDRMQQLRATTGIRVHSGAQEGMLYFVDGELSDATVDGLEGLEAAREVVSWHDVATEPVVRFRMQSEAHRILREDLFRPQAVPARVADPEPVLPSPSVNVPKPPRVVPPDPRRPLIVLNEAKPQPVLTSLMSVNGALLAVLVDVRRGVLLEQVGEGMDPLLLAVGYTDLLHTERKLASDMNNAQEVVEMVFAMQDQLHIVRVVSPTDDRFVGLVLDRDKAMLAMARMAIDQVVAHLLSD